MKRFLAQLQGFLSCEMKPMNGSFVDQACSGKYLYLFGCPLYALSAIERDTDYHLRSSASQANPLRARSAWCSGPITLPRNPDALLCIPSSLVVSDWWLIILPDQSVSQQWYLDFQMISWIRWLEAVQILGQVHTVTSPKKIDCWRHRPPYDRSVHIHAMLSSWVRGKQRSGQSVRKLLLLILGNAPSQIAPSEASRQVRGQCINAIVAFSAAHTCWVISPIGTLETPPSKPNQNRY